MALSALDEKPALILIDLQNGIVGLSTAHSTQDVVRHARALADAFRSRGLPVVLVNVTGTAPGRTEEARNFPRPPGWAELVPDLNRQPGDITVTKQRWGAFTGTDLDAQLQRLGVTQVVIAGVATSAGVESTARHAHEHGFNVTLAVDAMTDMSAEAHENSIKRIFPRLGETGTTQEIIDMLQARTI